MKTIEEKLNEMRVQIKFLEDVEYYMKKYELDEKAARQIVLDDEARKVMERGKEKCIL